MGYFILILYKRFLSLIDLKSDAFTHGFLGVCLFPFRFLYGQNLSLSISSQTAFHMMILFYNLAASNFTIRQNESSFFLFNFIDYSVQIFNSKLRQDVSFSIFPIFDSLLTILFLRTECSLPRLNKKKLVFLTESKERH